MQRLFHYSMLFLPLNQFLAALRISASFLCGFSKPESLFLTERPETAFQHQRQHLSQFLGPESLLSFDRHDMPKTCKGGKARYSSSVAQHSLERHNRAQLKLSTWSYAA